jgi:hypothetical protein
MYVLTLRVESRKVLRVDSSLAFKYQTRVEVTDSDNTLDYYCKRLTAGLVFYTLKSFMILPPG